MAFVIIRCDSDLNEEVYMKLPHGLSISGQFVSSAPLVYRLRKSLYGLCKASRQWYAKLSQALCSRGFTYSINDYSLFVKGSPGSLTVLVIYVDDMILTGDDLKAILDLKMFLHDQLKIKYLGTLNYFLGIEVSYYSSGLLLNQKKFIDDLLS